MAKKAYIGIPSKPPSEYTQLEYIESSGTQYIQTGVMCSTNSKMVLDYASTNTSIANKGIAGVNISSKRFQVYQSGTVGNETYGLGDGYAQRTADTNRHIVEIDAKNIKVLFDGTQLTTASGTFSNNVSVDSEIYVFAVNNGSAVCGYAKIYSLKIYDNDVLIRNFVPCKKSDGTLGLYDLTNEIFYTNSGTGTFIEGSTYNGSYESIARKIKKPYIGIPTEIPIYETTTGTVNITDSNISEYFTVTNGSTYYFKGSGGTFTSNNGGVKSSSATTTLTALIDISDLSFDYSYSSEQSCDLFTLTVAGTTVANRLSGVGSSTYSGSITKGQQISFTYSKDRSVNSNDDKCTFSNMHFTSSVTIQTGSEIKEVARRIKKAYFGIGGVARPCYNDGKLVYYGTITPLIMGRWFLAATTVGNYALFAGGDRGRSDERSEVDAYDTSLTRTTPTYLNSQRFGLSATTVGNYALFAGGFNTSYTSAVDAYDTSLTRTSPSALYNAYEIGATTIGNYALFAGGYGIGITYNSAYAYDTSLTRTTLTTLSVGRTKLAATSVGNYALFGGGSGPQSVVDAYDTSLTRTIPTELSVARYSLAATTIGNYGLFGGGSNGSQFSTVDAYDTSLTRILPTELSQARSQLVAITVEEYALFAGGESSAVVDAYDTSLTRTIPTELSVARYSLAATTIGNYALFGGGRISSSCTDTVDAYVVA